MNYKEYAAAAKAAYDAPLKSTETPKGQKFNIGDIVKISPNAKTWFAKKKIGNGILYKIEYSYAQKYGEGMDTPEDDSDLNMYSINQVDTDNSSAWYNDYDLELVEAVNKSNN